MTESEKQMWTTNILNLADTVTSALGYETVTFILNQYGASSVDTLNPCYYESVFNDLAAIEANIA